MTELEEMKYQIMATRPKVSDLGWWARFLLRFNKEFDSICSDTVETTKGKFTITYRMAFYKGKLYFRQFGG